MEEFEESYMMMVSQRKLKHSSDNKEDKLVNGLTYSTDLD